MLPLIRPRMALIGIALGLAVASGLAYAQAPAIFRIATGGAGGTYHAIGSLIARTISTPELTSTAVASSGSVANINAIASATAESGFVQADVAYWAYSGTGSYQGRSSIDELRSIANLYPENIHLVVRRAANVKSIADLKGRRVSIDEPGSGTLLNAAVILNAFGVEGQDFIAEYAKPAQAAELMKAGKIDAFFFTGGHPIAAIAALAESRTSIDILPIAGAPVAALRERHPFFTASEIPAGTYKGVGAVKTLAVGAHWVTSSRISDETVYAATKALWSEATLAALAAAHRNGDAIKRETALEGLEGVPLHPGAERYYREAGLLK
jgi:TRAP transporter TAXI family solute receptor